MNSWVRFLRVPVMVCLIAGLSFHARAAGVPELPYRFLLVISDQWKDPASHLIDGGGEFQLVASLLKTWGIPFEVLRLDQQRFDRYYLFDREDQPRYGTIIWDAGPAGMDGKDVSLLPELVKKSGVNLVILGDTVALPEVSSVAGVRYVSEYRLPDTVSAAGEHFISRGLQGRERDFLIGGSGHMPGSKVAADEAAIRIRRGHLPFLTTREYPGGGRVVWFGANRSTSQLGNQLVRDLFKRSLVWAQGYALYAEYNRSIMLFMDDFGTSDRSYLPYWHYRTLDEQDIRKGLIEPLKRHNAVMMQDVITGYVDRKGRRIANPWKQRVIDEIDGKTVHDYVSAKRGLDAGVKEGVLEIQCHGYTHMLPDLDSPPGPFWTAPMDGAGTLGFDEEFSDALRKNEVPAITQNYLMRQGLDYLRRDFGANPLFVINGGSGWSRSYPNNSPRLAAAMGFGLSHFNAPGYLGKDMVIADLGPVVKRGSWAYDRKPPTPDDVPWSVDGPYWIIFHDRDVSLDITATERLLTSLGPGVRYLSANEFAGYLHARIEQNEAAGRSLSLAVNYDPHYCHYFGSHDSKWTLHLSDEVRSSLKTAAPEKQTITIPRGVGRHVVQVGAQE